MPSVKASVKRGQREREGGIARNEAFVASSINVLAQLSLPVKQVGKPSFLDILRQQNVEVGEQLTGVSKRILVNDNGELIILPSGEHDTTQFVGYSSSERNGLRYGDDGSIMLDPQGGVNSEFESLSFFAITKSKSITFGQGENEVEFTPIAGLEISEAKAGSRRRFDKSRRTYKILFSDDTNNPGIVVVDGTSLVFYSQDKEQE